MLLNAFEFGRKIKNTFIFDDAKIELRERDDIQKISETSVPKLLKKFREINASRKAQGLGLFVMAMPLSACKGSSSASNSSGEEAQLFESITITGRAIDGYLADSSVSFGVFSLPDAPSAPALATSNAAGAQGSYTLEISDQDTLSFVDTQGGLGSTSVKGGVDVSTGKTFTGELKAPEGAKVITPITTLVEAVVAEAVATGAAPVSAEVAAAQVAKGLGLSSTTDLLNTDFVATGSAGMAKAAAKIASVISVVTASSGGNASEAVMSNIATKIAKAGAVGGKAKVLEDPTELTNVLNEVREKTPEAFTAAPETLDIAKLNASIASVVAKTNTQIESATSLKEIAVRQQAVQEDIVDSFTIDYEDAEALAAFDFEVFEAAITEADSNFEAFIAEAEAEMEAYIVESAELLGIDFDLDLDVSEIDTTVVAIDLDLIDAAIEGTLDDDLLTGFIFGDVDENILDGVIEGTIDAAAIEDIIDNLPEYVIFEPIDETPIDEIPVNEIPVDEIPVDEIPVDEIPVDEIPVDEITDAPVAAVGGGSSATIFGLTTSDNIQTSIDAASDGDIIVLAAGRYDQNITVNKDIDIRGANYGVTISADGSDSDSKVDEISEVSFDVADAARSGGTNETWINGTVTVATDGVTLDGLRLHSYNGPLDFSGTGIDNFTLQNSYVTGFEGSQSVRYNDTDGTASTGWTIDGNLIGGVAGGVGGSLYLTGVSSSTIQDNVFWRPGAAHMYLDNVSSLTVKDNFFVQGLHADGANSDGLLDDLVATSSWGYVGFSGGAGYGDVSGYGYGFGYGYDGSVATTSMGYGYGSEGGYGPTGYIPSGYGITSDAGGGTGYTYHGRNYVAEIKSDASNVTFTGNTAKYNSGGIQFWDEGDTDNVFTDITISNNTFTDFLNADPDGLLADVSSRHKSGLMGGVTYSVAGDNVTSANDSTSSGLTISGNTFTGSIGQVHNDNDIDSLILVQGGVENVNIYDNILSWDGSSLSDTATSMSSTTAVDGNPYKVYTQDIHLVGNVTGDIYLQDNDFDTDDITLNYASDAILLDGTDQSALGLGQLDSTVTISETGEVISTLSDYKASSAIFGGYSTASDEYGTLVLSGTMATSDLVVTTTDFF